MAPSSWSGRTDTRRKEAAPRPRPGRPLDFDLRYRGHWGINLHLTPQRLRVQVAASDAAPIRVAVNGEVAELAPGSAREFPL